MGSFDEIGTLMEAHLVELGLTHSREYRFDVNRRWRFDFAVFPEGERFLPVGVEIEGGAFLPGGGRHNRGASYVREMEKYNRAAVLGWRIVRFTPDQVRRGDDVEVLEKFAAVRGRR